MKPRIVFRELAPAVPVARDIGRALSGLAPERSVILAGAGVSIDAPASLPAAARFLSVLFDACLPESVDRSLLQPRRENPLAEPLGGIRFEAVVDLVQRRFDPALDLMLLYGGGRSNRNHVLLAELARRGAIVLTTNFDSLIECATDPVLPSRYATEEFASLVGGDATASGAVWHLHGLTVDAVTGADRRESIVASVRGCWTSRGFFRLGAPKEAALANILGSRDLVVVGYSGSDDFDICPAMERARSERRIVWVDHGVSDDPVQMIDLLTVDALPDGFQWYRHNGRNLLASMLARGTRRADRVAVLRSDTTDVLARLLGNQRGPVAPAAASDVAGTFITGWRDEHLPHELDRALLAIRLLLVANRRPEARALLSSVAERLSSTDPAGARSAIELISMSLDRAFRGIELRGPRRPSGGSARDAVRSIADPGVRAAMLLNLGRSLTNSGDASGIDAMEESIRLRREIGFDLDLDAVLHAHAFALFEFGQLDRALPAAEDALREAERVGSPEGIAWCSLLLARIVERLSEVRPLERETLLARAVACSTAALEAARACGIEHLVGEVAGEQGMLFWIEGAVSDHVHAAEMLAEAFRIHFAERDAERLLIVAGTLALCLESLGQAERGLYADCIAYQCADTLSDASETTAYSRVEAGARREGIPGRRPWESQLRFVVRVIRVLTDRGVSI